MTRDNNQEINDDFVEEIRRYFNMYDDHCFDFGVGIGGKSIYYNLFKEPVNRIFYCAEPEYSGSIMVIYEYKGIYIVSYGSFGSCHVCDEWEGIESLDQLQIDLERVFSRLQYYISLNDIDTKFYYSEYIIKKFNDFKIIEKV